MSPIVLFCDFGLPYTGQMKGRLVEELGQDAPNHPIIDLMHDVPAHDVQAGSILLAAHADDFPPGAVFVCVVDPGVGSHERKPGVVRAGGRWFVGPLNGLFEHVIRRWDDAEVFEITWQPPKLSNSFHGRDLFSPVAAGLALADGGSIQGLSLLPLSEIRCPDFSDHLTQIIYVDGFGNLMTGISFANLQDEDLIEAAGEIIPKARTFSDVEPGALFVYENAIGLAEISANLGRAEEILAIGVGSSIKITRL